MVNYKDHLGNYRLLKQLGESKLARVYLAEHIHLDTQAVIKVLHTQGASDEYKELFKQEAHILAHLDHPHILRIFNFDFDQGEPFLVMSYAPGGSLQERHPPGSRVPLSQVNAYVQQVAAALQYAHEQNIIHRNVKPRNLLVGAHGEILLTDFSIATQGRNIHGGIVGTPLYAAPEQMYRQAVAASDQYALGIIVYGWLSGHAPFQGTFAEILSQHVNAPVPSLRQQAEFSSAVEQVILRALEKQPEQRFPSLQAFARAFQNAIDQPVPVVLTPGDNREYEPSSLVQAERVEYKPEYEPDEEEDEWEDESPYLPLCYGAPYWSDLLIIPGYILALPLLILLAYILSPPTFSHTGALSGLDSSIVVFVMLLWVFIGLWMLLAGAILGWWRGSCALFLTGLLLYFLYPQASGPILLLTSTGLLCAYISGVLLERRRQRSFLTSWGVLSLAFILSSSWMMFFFEILGGPFLSPSQSLGEGSWMFLNGPAASIALSAIDCMHCLGGALFLAPLIAGIEAGIVQFDTYKKGRTRDNE
ncbi:serine/threonine-protein kinase [Ktedonospora formicarum]|uniref:Protein kinase domain-containing protein n=1 Tax=Ktedonospora formicarum TaxID=2778364 RepID=A0A8J3MYK9_9CHLR|nr:serine/threonine-protein kinase [Ktedonospora formicarum]GHO51056.1 hypothetical protein KSX_92190 [Ktedonospora formicarum]